MDEISELAKQGRIRNSLLAVQALGVELRAAAERVMRLSEPGKPERFFALMEVAQESGLTSNAIVDAIQKINRARKTRHAR